MSEQVVVIIPRRNVVCDTSLSRVPVVGETIRFRWYENDTPKHEHVRVIHVEHRDGANGGALEHSGAIYSGRVVAVDVEGMCSCMKPKLSDPMAGDGQCKLCTLPVYKPRGRMVKEHDGLGCDHPNASTCKCHGQCSCHWRGYYEVGV